jgi:hypothetical protein
LVDSKPESAADDRSFGRGAPGWLSLSGPKRIRMITTFFGAMRVLVPASVCFFSPVTERR